MSQSSSTSSGLGYRHSTLQDAFKIVSEQSTSRPGCIIELDSIMDAHHVSKYFFFSFKIAIFNNQLNVK